MSMISLSVKHGRTLEEARVQLERAVQDVQARFGGMIQRVEWSPGRDGAKLFGPGFEVEMRIDNQEVHVTGDFPILGNLLSGPLVSGLKGIVQKTFEKRLPGPSSN